MPAAESEATNRSTRLMGAALAFGLAIAAPVTAQTALYRINNGGGAFTDGQGRAWQADQYYNVGNVYSVTQAIANTTDDALYQTERWDAAAAPEMMYTLPIPAAGQYQVRLHFAELVHTSIGARVFDVKIEGQTVLDNLDIFALAGIRSAMVREFTLNVADGALNIEFVHQVENPKISAIEVIAVSAPPPPPPPSGTSIRINTGGPAFTDNLGQAWEADRNYNAGNAYTVTSAIANTVNDVLYQSMRWDPSAAPAMQYAFPLVSGSYTVRLHFAETWATATNVRVFDALLEGALVLDNFDIFAVAGANSALVREFTVNVADGTLNISFTHGVDNPMISALEIIPVTAPPPPPPPTAATIRVNAGGGAFTDNLGQVWEADRGSNTGNTYSTTNAIANTVNDAMYQTERWDASTAPEMMYTLPLASGSYQVRLHFAEIARTANGQRVFDVKIEGVTLLDNLDIHAEVGAMAALVKEFTVNVTDGALNIEFVHQVENPKVSAIEVIAVSTPPPPPPPVGTTVRVNAGGAAFTDNLGQVWEADRGFNTGNIYTTTSSISNTVNDVLYQSERWDASAAPTLQYALAVTPGNYTVRLHFAEIYATAAAARVFDVKLEGAMVLDNFDILAETGPNTAVVKEFTANIADGTVNIELLHVADNPKISAIEILPAADPGHKDPYLHVVIVTDPYVVDYDQNGSQNVHLDGADSHTHEPGRQLLHYEWTQGGSVLADATVVDHVFPLGQYTVDLTISDDGTPERYLSDSVSIKVVPPSQVPGSLVLAYRAGTANPVALLDQVPAQADHARIQNGLALSSQEAGFTVPGMARFVATVNLPAAGTYLFQAAGGLDRRLFVNGIAVTGAESLPAGPATVEARFAFQGTGNFPLSVTYGFNGGAQAPVTPNLVTHVETDMPPVLNSITPEGPEAGGNLVTLTGLGFFPASSVTVTWGNTALFGSSLTVKPNSIQFNAPAGVGTVQVTVQTQNGTTLPLRYIYQAGQLPIQFAVSNLAAVNQPTQAAWGPDGRLYVAGLDGKITILTLNDSYAVTATQVVNSMTGLTNKAILGIAFNPKEAAGPVKIYVSHGQLYANGGTCAPATAPYPGQVSVLTGPAFATAVPLITGLPVSNLDHSVNGLEFDLQGDLFIAVGSPTNAGVEHCGMGGLPESPLTSAILKAQTSKVGFNGNIRYVLTSNGQESMNAALGGQVDVKAGVDVSVFAAGFRNPFDLALATTGHFYATDNGPNTNMGLASTSATTQTTTHAADVDELNLLVQGAYYGHPNRNRGRTNSRQNVYYGSTAASVSGVFSQALTTFPSSVDGIFEYRAATFGGAMRGNLILQKYQGTTYRIVMGSGGTTVASSQTLFAGTFSGLDVTSGPGGVIFGTAYTGNQVMIAKPVAAGSGFVTFDIHPWRAPAAGGAAFEIGGMGFGTLATTTVTIGGIPAQLTSVTATRIKGTLPAHSAPPASLVDVDVQVGGVTRTLPAAFRYLAP